MMTSNRFNTLDQRRASHAWEAVQDIVQNHVKKENGKLVPDAHAKAFGSQARKLPSRIIASGLGQALTFLYAKGLTPDLLTEIGDWVLDKSHDSESKNPKPRTDALIKQIITQPSDYLRAATSETLAYLQWLIRFAEAEGLLMKDLAGD
jgi:CRISPR-associated protein Cmr5